MVRSILPIGAALLGVTSVLAASTKCSEGSLCPKDSPCCSQYGECGIGAYCLGGCDPRFSFSLDSCVPEPVCESKTMTLDSLDRVISIDKYLGDASKADWVSSGEPLVYNDNLLLTMPAHSVGTVLASTVYMWYGNVKARLKSSRGNGVVTAFILLSDVKDEIDFEFIGADLGTAQTNYYFQAMPIWTHSANITDISDTYENFHEYEIDWTPDQITWLVDGKAGRTLKRADTWNATSNQWDYPQTPARVELSLWPGGASSNAQGTIDWAGGAIDWSSSDIKTYGYDFATFSSVTIECYNGTHGVGTNNGASYYYNDISGLNNTVVDGKKDTVLASFQGTGTDMNAGADTKSSSAGSSSPTANTVPGGSGAVGNTVGSDSSGGGSGSGSGSGSSNGGSSTGSSPDCATTGFTQSCGGNGGAAKSSSGAAGGNEKVFGAGASAFAAIVAFVFLMWL